MRIYKLVQWTPEYERIHTIHLGPLRFQGNVDLWWVRMFGYGISVANRKRHAELFSQRNGLVKVLRLGKWSIRTLKP